MRCVDSRPRCRCSGAEAGAWRDASNDCLHWFASSAALCQRWNISLSNKRDNAPSRVSGRPLPMQALLHAIAKMDLSTDTQRVFHGRGGLYPGCEHLALDAYPPVWLLTSFQPLDDGELASIHDALVERLRHLAPGQTLNWVFQCRWEGRTETRLMAGSVPEQHVVTEGGTRFRVHVLKGQNHGLFLDMAEGRRWVREHVFAQGAGL